MHSRSSLIHNLICCLIATGVFLYSWINCLPFSGYMPVIEDHDSLSFFGTFLLYAKKPFTFPVGIVENLSFPFHAGNISRGSIPLFAILFKAFSSIYPPFAEMYYFGLVEILSVFAVGFFACLILDQFNIYSFWMKLLGSVLTALSAPLLFRSSSDYYGVSFVVANFPLYMAFGYFYIRTYTQPNIRSMLLLSSIFPIAASIDPSYLIFGISLMAIVCVCINFIEYILVKSRDALHRFSFILLSVFIGIFLSFTTLFILGNQGNLEVEPGVSAAEGRYSKRNWGYGGGYGGGFHVADVLTLFIAPVNDDDIPVYKRLGPTAHLAKLGFPLTSDRIQNGQYEGFAYLGTTSIGILFFLLFYGAATFARNWRNDPDKPSSKIISHFNFKEPISLPVTLGIATGVLFVFSLGYIIHIGGVRFNDIPTPSFILAKMWPKFMFARSLGRLAIPIFLFITICIVICFGKYFHRITGQSTLLKKSFAFIVCVLIVIHLLEVWGYLKKPGRITRGNDIARVFGDKDITLIKKLTENKKAIILIPKMRKTFHWNKISYSLGFHSEIPLSGPTLGFGERIRHNDIFRRNRRIIREGNIKKIVDLYGDIVIASPRKIADEILKTANIPMHSHQLQDQDVVILTTESLELPIQKS